MQIGRLLRSPSFRVGIMLLAVTVVLFFGLEWLATSEQASSPGEKNLGVAVLGMLFGVPMLISGIGGLGCVIVSVFIWVHNSLFRSESDRPNSSSTHL
jgi:hypothetical protein